MGKELHMYRIYKLMKIYGEPKFKLWKLIEELCYCGFDRFSWICIYKMDLIITIYLLSG